MKVALAQIDPIVGDIEGNGRKIVEQVRLAQAAGADLAVFPELSITGYPPRDLLDHARFIDANLEALERIADEVEDTYAVVGFVDRDKSGRLPGLLNAAALLHHGRVVSIHHKSLLPTYDVFDEVRYFSTAEEVHVVNLTSQQTPAQQEEGAAKRLRGVVGISICEDAWNDPAFWRARRYAIDPISALAKKGAEFFVNLSASPYEFGKRDLRTRMLSELAKKHRRFFVYVNQAGGNDELVFDGNSMVFAPDGRVIARAREFHEDFVVVDLDANASTVHVPPEDIGSLHDALVCGLGDYLHKNGFTQAALGLSGGIDSAVVACLAAEALGPGNVRAVSMPSPYSSLHSLDDARTLAKNLGIRYDVARIDGAFAAMLDTLKPLFKGAEPGIAEENVQARVRGMLLMALSNKFGEIVLATGNKSELSTGYCTLYGDMCGGIAPIGDVPKMKVYALGRHNNRKREIIPENTFAKPPSAELKPNQTDQDTLPPYNVLDDILQAYIEEMKSPEEIVKAGFDEATVRKVVHMIWRSEYKRKQAAPVIKVTTKAFGIGRRMPIAQRWV